MGVFLDKIMKRIAAAKGNTADSGRTMTGERPNQVIVNPEIVMRNEETEPGAFRRHHAFFWGRANPPHAGHQQAYDLVKSLAKKYGGTSSIVLSRTYDPKKNPLTPAQKEKHAKRAFPDVNTSVADAEHPTLLHQLSKLHENGVTDLHMVAGQDRIPEYQKLINQYNGKEGPHGYYNFKNVMIHSSGDRDPDAEGVAGISASSQRDHATKGDAKSFASGAPTTMNKKHVQELYNDVRAGLSAKPKAKGAK